MESENIEKLYQTYHILAEAKDKISEHEKEYLVLLQAAKGTNKEKRLASSFLTRFFKYFPSLLHQTLNTLIDLCEDADITTRIQAIKDLPALCKNNNFTSKISNILTQLLQSKDSIELSTVNNSLMTLLKSNSKDTLAGIFLQILNGEEIVREKAIQFLFLKSKTFYTLSTEAENFLILKTKEVLDDVTAVEFKLLMNILISTKIGKTISGHQEILTIIAKQIDITKKFNPPSGEEIEYFNKLIDCLQFALPYFSYQVRSTRFVVYITEEILPKLDTILQKIEEKESELMLYRILAELCTFCGALDAPEETVLSVYNRLILFMPEPTDIEVHLEPNLNFSAVECLMYAFHKLASQVPSFITSDKERYNSFKIKLQYFARCIQGHVKDLGKDLVLLKNSQDLNEEKNQLKVLAFKTTSNIDTMIKDFFHARFKSVIVLSWKPSLPVKREAGQSKSFTPKKKQSMKFYTPPKKHFTFK